MSSKQAAVEPVVHQTYQQTDFPTAEDHQEHLFVAELLRELRISQQCCLMLLAVSLKMDLLQQMAIQHLPKFI